MASSSTLVFYGLGHRSPPGIIRRFAEAHSLHLLVVKREEEVISLLNRSFPACLVLDATDEPDPILELCASLKSDAFTSIVPTVVIVTDRGKGVGELPAAALQAGADEVVSDLVSDREKSLRLELVLRRASRDVNVHPTTRLPGTAQIERDLAERMAAGGTFAVCYADLDNFKEFNDRYGYNFGDSVIFLVSKILRDVVRALAPGGFVGHIGGDDFIFNVPIEYLEPVCDEIIQVFDELAPYQYSQEDRKAGYFLGKDRRGTIHRIPLMTLSIGVVTNHMQEFSHTAQVSELASEMKTYAKTLPGSVYVVDRRGLSDPSRVHPARAGATPGDSFVTRKNSVPTNDPDHPL
jgi:GGDEF domain-containing protein